MSTQSQGASVAKKNMNFINRELSWLEFNQRVLDEATNETVPLLERLGFLAITSSNLDEFFMVRVGGLKLLVRGGIKKPDPSGLSPLEQLARIYNRAHRMVADQYTCYRTQIEPELLANGIRRTSFAELSLRQREALAKHFDSFLFPIATPMALDGSDPFPLLANLGLYMGVALKPEGRKRKPRYAVVPIGTGIERVVSVQVESGVFVYILVEDLVREFVDRFFPGQEILACAPFRITRNADMSIQEEFASDLIAEMEKVLNARQTSGCVRLEVAVGASPDLVSFLVDVLSLEEQDVFQIDGPLDVTALRSLISQGRRASLLNDPWPPQPSAMVDSRKSMFSEISRGDIFLSVPFESFDPVVRFVQEAAEDPDVMAIKQILYRTSSGSPVIAALRRAAENGKYVTAIVEIKARFDEANNMVWARELERAGVQVVYGIRGFKTHGKICVVVRREPEGVVRYVHFGTGNYNDNTAKLYCDVGILTRNDDLGSDASAFFNAICGYSEPQQYRKLVQAPLGLRKEILELIEGETERRRQGQKALIMAKMNSLVDPEIIEALYRASQVGVDIRLNVRGICCLRPGKKELSESIQVVSIVDRFLEHSRIFYFHQGGAKRVYISSADWMPRNLDRRIELLVPIEEKACKKRLIEILKICLADTVKGRRILSDGTYENVAAEGKKALRSQTVLYQQACAAANAAKVARRTVFEPHLPPDKEP